MPEAPPRTHLRRRLGQIVQIVQIVFVVDVIAMFGISLIAWDLQQHVDQFAAGIEEFRNLGTGSILALGLVATLGYLTQTQHSQGLPLLMFVAGTPMLLLSRYAQRKALHARRSRDHLVNHVLAVGSPVAVAEL